MTEKKLKSGLTVRGDSVYCPLAFSLDSYWNCLTDCWHCYLRHLNRTWGTDLRPLDLEEFSRKLRNGVKNKKPQSVLAHCLANKKTVRWGNKTDPFQVAERKHRLAPHIFSELIDLQWTFVIQTMHTDVMMEYRDQIMEAQDIITVMPIVSPGMDKDWEVLERKRTNPASERLKHAAMLSRRGINVGINGEPFIPGYHTVDDFEDVLKRLKSLGLNRYNTYNLHFNAFVAERLHGIGLDIEAIWEGNQDKNWKPVLQKLLDLSKKYDIILGCPDFVNTGPDWMERANTCCGVDVQNPTTFNSHHFKKGIQLGHSPERLLEALWDGSSKFEEGEAVVRGTKSDFYTLRDAGVLDGTD